MSIIISLSMINQFKLCPFSFVAFRSNSSHPKIRKDSCKDRIRLTANLIDKLRNSLWRLCTPVFLGRNWNVNRKSLKMKGKHLFWEIFPRLLPKIPPFPRIWEYVHVCDPSCIRVGVGLGTIYDKSDFYFWDFMACTYWVVIWLAVTDDCSP